MICDSCGGDIEYGEEFYLFEGEKFCKCCFESNDTFQSPKEMFEMAGGKICTHEEDYD